MRRKVLRSGLAALTPREKQVLNLIVAGCSTKESALRIGVTPETISRYRANVYRKLGVRGSVQAAAVAITGMRGEYAAEVVPGPWCESVDSGLEIV